MFVWDHVGPKVVNDVLQTVPDDGAAVNFKETLKALGVVRQSPRVLAASYSMQGEVDGIILLITNLNQGRPPKEADIPQLTTLTKQMLKRCEEAFQVVVPMGALVGDQALSHILRGAQAIQHLYKEAETQMSQQIVTMSLLDLKPLSQYRWVLTTAQRSQVQEWVRRVATMNAAPGAASKAIVDATEGDELSIVPLIEASRSGGAVSSSSSGLQLERGAVQTKKAVSQCEKRELERSEILDWFKVKSRKVGDT